MWKKKISTSAIWSIWRAGWRISAMVWKERKWGILFLLGITLFISAAPFLNSGARGLLINELVRVVSSDVFSGALVWLVSATILISVISSGAYKLQEYFSKQFWFFLEEKFEVLVARRRGEIDIAHHEDPKKNDLFNKIAEYGVWRVRSFIDRQFRLFGHVVEVAIASSIIFVAQWWVLLLILIATVPELLVEFRYSHLFYKLHTKQAEKRRRMWHIYRYFEWVPWIVELKLFQLSKRFVSILRESIHGLRSEEMRLERRRLFHALLALFGSNLLIAFAGIWFIVQVIHGSIQIGTFTFYLASIGSLRQALSSFFYNLGQQYQDGLYTLDVFRLIDMEPAIKKPKKGLILSRDKTPKIVFENVSFCYPGTQKKVIKELSLTIFPGEKIALVGANGAGKTTLMKLLFRFYDPTKGRILIDGTDIRKINIESWYSIVGALFQEYANYNFLVKQAISFGRINTMMRLSAVKKAAKASESDQFIRNWKDRYDQMLGRQFSGGIEPSVGQWQKLALARAFYRDARVLILDEPTSSIDAEAEAKIFDGLRRLPKDHTVIFISHRFSTVRQAQKICVIEKGNISELGSHQDLIKNNKTYARLFRLQARGYW